jgi:hypothetical protein
MQLWCCCRKKDVEATILIKLVKQVICAERTTQKSYKTYQELRALIPEPLWEAVLRVIAMCHELTQAEDVIPGKKRARTQETKVLKKHGKVPIVAHLATVSRLFECMAKETSVSVCCVFGLVVDSVCVNRSSLTCVLSTQTSRTWWRQKNQAGGSGRKQTSQKQSRSCLPPIWLCPPLPPSDSPRSLPPLDLPLQVQHSLDPHHLP